MLAIPGLITLAFQRAECERKITEAEQQIKDMKTEKDGWIKMSDRKPTEADLPIIQGGFTESCGWTQLFTASTIMTGESWTHWYPMNKIPEPPKRSMRDEQDCAACRQIYDKQGDLDMTAFRRGFFAALEDEREYLRSIMDKYTANEISIQETLKRVKERVA